jgi:dihydroorotase
MNEITITAPDDWHCHLRDGNYLTRTVFDTATRFRRAIIMPNLKPPVTTVMQAVHYAERIRQCIPADLCFDPLLTLYLTEETPIELITEAKDTGFIVACKLYPAGATTHSAAGVKHIEKIYPVLAAMEEIGLILCIHGESIEPEIDVFDREERFIDKNLTLIMEKFPKLKIVLEHISSRAAVEFVKNASSQLAATITVHHMLLNRNDLLVGGLHPHYFCLPVVKREEDRVALIEAAISGNSKFFLGTDSAPHPVHDKESHVCAAGVYTAHAAIELYAEIFERHQSLHRLEGFASVYGARFYGLPQNQEKMTLIKSSWEVPETLTFGNDQLIPLRAKEQVHWKIA